MLESQIDQAERRRVLDNDRRVREQSGTMHAHAIADAQQPRGRFSAVETSYVVGSKPTISYPAASAAHQTELPPEPSLGYSVDALEPSELAGAQVQTEPTSAQSPRDVGSLSSSGPATGETAFPPQPGSPDRFPFAGSDRSQHDLPKRQRTHPPALVEVPRR